MSLHVLAYNLKRVIRILGISRTMKVSTQSRRSCRLFFASKQTPTPQKFSPRSPVTAQSPFRSTLRDGARVSWCLR